MQQTQTFSESLALLNLFIKSMCFAAVSSAGLRSPRHYSPSSFSLLEPRPGENILQQHAEMLLNALCSMDGR